MHATLLKFGYPNTLLREFEHWCVLMRLQQCTLGASVLVAKSEVPAFSDLPPGAFAELAHVTKVTETALRHLFEYEKINYLMLMMVDPQCHFHVLPRFSSAREHRSTVFNDLGWPGPPDLKLAATLTDAARNALHTDMKAAFSAC